jgi:hypothetical protein
MKTAPQIPAQPARGAATPPQRSGPVPLDPALLRHVAGGLSPRGGWSANA